jgi:hypothetical protein
MVRTLALSVSLALSVAIARPASAIPVTPVDLGTVTLGSQVGSAMMDDFAAALPPPPSIGDATTRVFFDGLRYVYTQTVFPTSDFNFAFNTEFAVSGFTGVAGWRFSDAASAGAGGAAGSFLIERTAGQLSWFAMPGTAFPNWNAFEPITFFFVSTLPPTIKSYSLFSLIPGDVGTAQGLAPVPEPGSIALFGSGLVALYTAVRRRRSLRM